MIDGSKRRAMRRVGASRRVWGHFRACGGAYSRFWRLQAALCARLRTARPPPRRAGA